ncbi:helix-turn-helix domain-containing protein [Streptomyces sp. NEAU-W12]|uniref:helix-turn-helix domain-containing protein n=1 Tax=Streptomyces sp. NEAU-W12 TaxID=2994668 RepID=UPI00224A8F6E|nr:helix-turn-helix domain-containing protein [Streptomyces sp. NEAU-W12]MCX2928516.1 helix-turn-helix domain-containing protein [Streptomyces sp. NEAU-W12]
MGIQNPNVPPRAQARVPGDKSPNRGRRTGGLAHDNTRHTARFTVIGNHLAQHGELSLLAIGLGTHLQSLPKGAPADIRTLAARFPEGATRIAAALRELETHGYLRRERVRTPAGRIVTRTTSCNQPTAARHGTGKPAAASAPAAAPALTVGPPAAPASPVAAEPQRSEACEERTQPEARGTRAPRKPLPDVPHPGCSVPGLFQAAADLLADLHRRNPHLLLSAADTAHLAPGVAAWLERDVTPSAVRHALSADLPPEGVRRPAALLAHRLTAQLPPPPPFRAPAGAPPVETKVRNCDGCDRGFRAPVPGPDRCRDCRTECEEAA